MGLQGPNTIRLLVFGTLSFLIWVLGPSGIVFGRAPFSYCSVETGGLP